MDTQLKRLGGPNFTQLPINAPKCPFAHFQQDGHMAFRNPVGRTNYEPNSRGAAGGPRETPEAGFRSFPEPVHGEKVRVRSERFADHYSQARQFFISQTDVEQKHIASALTFELSKCEEPAIRGAWSRTCATSTTISRARSRQVSGSRSCRRQRRPRSRPTPTIEPSPALSILENGPESFAGRKLGIVVADGTSAADVTALVEAVTAAKATAEVIAPAVGGAKADDGSMLVANGQLAGNPSVVFDAVAIVVNEAGAKVLAEIPAARDFVADAFAHCKFIGYSPEARPLLERALGGFTPDLGNDRIG